MGQVWGRRGIRETEAALHHVSQLLHTVTNAEPPAHPSWVPEPSLVLRSHPGQVSCTPQDGCHPAGTGLFQADAHKP